MVNIHTYSEKLDFIPLIMDNSPLKRSGDCDGDLLLESTNEL